MPATVLRHVMEPALIPGATGRADLRSSERAAIVTALAGALDGALAGALDGADTGAGSADSVLPVLVVAPARRSYQTSVGRPDLGALGLDPAVVHGALGQAPLVGTVATPSLDVVAGVAVTLLRLAGWHGPVETIELGAPADDPPEDDDVLTGRRLVLLALAAPDAVLPPGAHPGLAAGQAQVWALAERWLG